MKGKGDGKKKKYQSAVEMRHLEGDISKLLKNAINLDADSPEPPLMWHETKGVQMHNLTSHSTKHG